MLSSGRYSLLRKACKNVKVTPAQVRMFQSIGGFSKPNGFENLRLQVSAPFSTQAKEQLKYFGGVEVVDGVGVLKIDGPGKMNTIDAGFVKEMEQIWDEQIMTNNDIKSAVLISSKPDNFIAGADIKMISSIEDKSSIKNLCMEAHNGLFKKLSNSSKPLVAAINGACMGGGLEVALYCDARVATTNKKTVLSLPEVKLGILPGFGGTQNLHKLVGIQAALDMMLTGKNVRPDKAKKIGLVDQVVDPAALESVAIQMAKDLQDPSYKIKRKPKSFVNKILEDSPLNNIVFKKAGEMVQKNTNGKYPAPFAILDCVREGLGKSKEDALEYEATRFAELAATNESAALIGIFNGMNHLKKNRFGKPAKPINTVGILGAGLMGAGIAQVSAEKGYNVLLKDRDVAGVGRGQSIMEDAWKKKVKRRRMSNHDYCLNSSRIIPLHDSLSYWEDHFKNADMVIEAVFEDLGLKHRIVQQFEQILPDHAVLASNTSALPIASIAEVAKRPENVVGMHYFSPVPMMPLIEVIPHEGTAKEVSAAAVEVGTKQGKTVIVVKDVPGFYVNRCLGPYLVETCGLIEDGVELEKLDKAMKSYGLPMGPLSLADMVGMDVANHVQSFLSKADLGVRMSGGNTQLMSDMVEKGMLGQKSGKGFFIHDKKSKKPQLNPEAVEMAKAIKKHDLKLSVEDIQLRMISRFVNEAVLCLQDGIIESPIDGDIGAVFGMGFPPFMGGPFQMVDAFGVKKFHDKMQSFADAYGEQFRPCQLLQDMAKDNKKFH